MLVLLLPFIVSFVIIMKLNFYNVEKSILNKQYRSKNSSFFYLIVKITIRILFIRFFNGILLCFGLYLSLVLEQYPISYILYFSIFYVLFFIVFFYFLYNYKNEIYLFKVNFKKMMYSIKKNKWQFFLLYLVYTLYATFLIVLLTIILYNYIPTDSNTKYILLVIFNINIFNILNVDVLADRIALPFWFIDRVRNPDMIRSLDNLRAKPTNTSVSTSALPSIHPHLLYANFFLLFV